MFPLNNRMEEITMAQYIKLTTGSVSMLVALEDTQTLQEKMADGFYAETDKDGEVVLVDSSELNSTEDSTVRELLDRVKGKKIR